MKHLNLRNINIYKTKSQYDEGPKSANELHFIPTQNIIETYVNGTSWYRVYSDGYCEQGGRASWGSNVTDIARLQVSLLKPYKDTNYSLMEMPLRTDMNGASNGLCAAFVGVFDLQKTTFCLRAYCGNTNERINIIQWQACGYVS